MANVDISGGHTYFFAPLMPMYKIICKILNMKIFNLLQYGVTEFYTTNTHPDTIPPPPKNNQHDKIKTNTQNDTHLTSETRNINANTRSRNRRPLLQ